MGTTTFSGPVKAGPIKDTTGTTVGTDVANVGFVAMQQATAIDIIGASATTTVATIPPNSTIVNVDLVASVVNNDTGTGTVSVGPVGDAAGYIAATNVKAVGRHTPGATKFATASFMDTGSTGVQVIATFAAQNGDGTTGTAYVVVSYIQNTNLVP